MIIYAVVVTYYPDIEALTALVDAIERDGCGLVIVDNTPEGCAGIREMSRSFRLISPGWNMGIAKAQNLGVELALCEGAEAVVLFDQDSEVVPGMITALASGLEGGRPSVVAPACIDGRTGRELPSFALRKRWGFLTPEKVYSTGRRSRVEVDLVISSGLMATAEAFRAVGNMREGLFIDFVDFEWCLRCRSRKVAVHVIPAAVMRHHLGDRTLEFGLLRAVLHKSDRTYYKVRNGFLILRLEHVPSTYAAREIFASLIQSVLLIPFSESPMLHLRALIQGLWDGARGIEGKRM